MKLFYKNLLVAASFFFVVLSCSNSKKDKPKEQKLRLFITNKKIDLNNKFNHFNQDTLIEFYETDKFYIENKMLNGTKFKWINVYNKSNLLLTTEKREYADFDIGISRIYSENGKLIKEKNYDEDFPFSIDDLIVKMKKEYNIDLNNQTLDGFNIYVNRGIDENSNTGIYTVDYNYPHAKYRYFKINGNTGDVIIDKIKFYQD